MESINDKIIKQIRRNIVEKGEFPEFGSPEMKCDKCMFRGVACFPSPQCVGCFSGWKRSSER